MATLTFTTWLYRQARRGDPVGDLGWDVARDPDWPQRGRTLGRFLRYFDKELECAPDEGVYRALRLAWMEYELESGHRDRSRQTTDG
jgi:hypothetical protein